MYETRWSTKDEITIIVDFWCRMANEMGEHDGTPKPDIQRIEQVKNLFIRECESGNLKFRVAIDRHDHIVACAVNAEDRWWIDIRQ